MSADDICVKKHINLIFLQSFDWKCFIFIHLLVPIEITFIFEFCVSICSINLLLYFEWLYLPHTMIQIYASTCFFFSSHFVQYTKSAKKIVFISVLKNRCFQYNFSLQFFSLFFFFRFLYIEIWIQVTNAFISVIWNRFECVLLLCRKRAKFFILFSIPTPSWNDTSLYLFRLFITNFLFNFKNAQYVYAVFFNFIQM